MTRPSWDETWMRMADTMALRSRCELAQVGAVIVDAHNRPVSTGYNGPARNLDTVGTCSNWCMRCITGDRKRDYGLSCPSIHAEANALMFADRSTYEGGTIYVSRSCCADCAKLVSNSGIARVVMRVTEKDKHRKPRLIAMYLRDCGLQVDLVHEETPVTIELGGNE